MPKRASSSAIPSPERRAVLKCLAAAPVATAFPLPGRAAIRTADEAELGAAEAVQAIRSGDLKAEAYMAVLLDRAARYKRLNAFTRIDEARALESARAVDLARSAGKRLGAVGGLPLVVKDNIDTLGFPTSAGTPGLKGNRPHANAPVVERLLRQGAVLMGKANMHELASGGTSTNPTFGFVRNPYDPSRIPGGSSGGTAAAIAARLAPAGLGTDTAGSVRVPACFCGIAGLRPTTAGDRGAYVVDGVVPLEFSLDTIGPMARTVVDVALLDSAITGRALPQPARLAGLRIGLPRKTYWEQLDQAVSGPLDAALERLKERGVVFVDVDLNGAEQRALAYYSLLAAAGFGRDFAAYLSGRGLDVTAAQVIEQIASPTVKARFEQKTTPPSAEAVALAQARDLPGIVGEYQAIFRANGIQALAFPTEPVVAPPISEDGDHNDATIQINGVSLRQAQVLVRNTRQTGGLGFPGLNVPVGLSAGGLPVGLELDGLPHSDAALLGVGMAVEAALGRLPPPALNA